MKALPHIVLTEREASMVLSVLGMLDEPLYRASRAWEEIVGVARADRLWSLWWGLPDDLDEYTDEVAACICVRSRRRR